MRAIVAGRRRTRTRNRQTTVALVNDTKKEIRDRTRLMRSDKQCKILRNFVNDSGREEVPRVQHRKPNQ